MIYGVKKNNFDTKFRIFQKVKKKKVLMYIYLNINKRNKQIREYYWSIKLFKFILRPVSARMSSSGITTKTQKRTVNGFWLKSVILFIYTNNSHGFVIFLLLYSVSNTYKYTHVVYKRVLLFSFYNGRYHGHLFIFCVFHIFYRRVICIRGWHFWEE